jgi:hypothetical protein
VTSGDALTHAAIQASDDSTFAPRPEIPALATELEEFAAAEILESDATRMAPQPPAAYAPPLATAPVIPTPDEASPAISEVIDAVPSTPAHAYSAPPPVEPERVAPAPVTLPPAAAEEPPRPVPVEAAAAPSRPEPASTAAPPATQANLDEALRESGLVLIETSPANVQAAAPPVEEEPAGTPGRRERRAPPPDIDQPLQQVETRK